MKNSSFLWQMSGSLQELANRLESARLRQDWRTVAIIAKILEKKAKRCEEKADECYEKQD